MWGAAHFRLVLGVAKGASCGVAEGETTWGTLSVASARRNSTLNADNSTATNIWRQYDFAGGADLTEGRDEIRAARLSPLYLSNAWASSHS
jgi:hypothetical protein